MATATNDKPVRLGDLPVVKTNILENARQYDKGVVGGYSGTFPLTAASKGGIYLLPSTGKFYVCETAYNGAQISAPNSNFVELSVWKNHDRLNNLESSRGFTRGILKKSYDNTIQHYFDKNKVSQIYAPPSYFTDLTFLPSQDEYWEFILLYYGELGIRLLANCSSYVYLIYSWNNSLNEKTLYKQL